MNFKHEVGGIVNEFGETIAIIDGGMGHVEFPWDTIWELHNKRPGYIYKLTHTHPTGMSEMSHNRDRITLKAWAWAMHPFPVRLSVVTWLPDEGRFIETDYMATVEPKEIWLERGKAGARKTEIFMHEIKTLTESAEILIERSFE